MLTLQDNLKGGVSMWKSLEKNPILNYKVTPEDMWHEANGDTKSFGIEG